MHVLILSVIQYGDFLLRPKRLTFFPLSISRPTDLQLTDPRPREPFSVKQLHKHLIFTPVSAASSQLSAISSSSMFPHFASQSLASGGSLYSSTCESTFSFSTAGVAASVRVWIVILNATATCRQEHNIHSCRIVPPSWKGQLFVYVIQTS